MTSAKHAAQTNLYARTLTQAHTNSHTGLLSAEICVVPPEGAAIMPMDIVLVAHVFFLFIFFLYDAYGHSLGSARV